MAQAPNTLERVYAIFDAIPPNANGCKDVRTYQRISINGKGYGATRLALERKLGRPIKPGLLALHTCDFRRCINPDHLYEGSYSDNSRDAYERNPVYRDNLLRAGMKGNLAMTTDPNVHAYYENCLTDHHAKDATS
jgi:hypothetical protein